MREKFQHRYTFHALITVLIIGLLGLAYGAYSYFHQTTYPPNSNSNIVGILLNQEDGYLDFNELEKSSIDFVYLKATQGKSYFDDRYLTNRDRVQASNLEYGTVHYFSNESSPTDQFNYLQQKVGSKVGQLPLLIVPAINNPSGSFYKQEATFAKMLVDKNIKVMVLGNYQKLKSFFGNLPITYMANSTKSPTDKNDYQMWRYTTDGRVAGKQALNNLTMFTYLHSQAAYNNFIQ